MRKLSKGARLSRILKNLNKDKGRDLEKLESELSFQIWIVEKEFGFLITDDFPQLKFANLVKKKHIERYNEMSKPNKNDGKEIPKTIGR